MGLSQLSEKCRRCPFCDTCNHKLMEAVAYLPETQIAINMTQADGKDAAQPLIRETITIHTKGELLEVYKDEIEKQLYEHLYSHLGLRCGS